MMLSLVQANILVVLVSVLAQKSIAQQTPCPQYFNYAYDGTTGQYYGVIEVQSPRPATTLQLEISMSVKAILPDVSSNYIGIIFRRSMWGFMHSKVMLLNT